MRAVMVVVLFGMIAACVPQSHPSDEPKRAEQPGNETQIHTYEIYVTDTNKNPIPRAKIEYTLKGNDSKLKSETFVTREDGMLKDSIRVSRDPRYSSLTVFGSQLEYTISADGYYTKSGVAKSDYGSNYESSASPPSGGNPKISAITLYKPTDYFDAKFIEGDKNRSLQLQIIKFIDLINTQGFLPEASLEYRSVAMTDFENRKYVDFRFRFKQGVVYNPLKLNKNDIARDMFNEVIRKILNPLNDTVRDPDRLSGYDIIMVAYTKRLDGSFVKNQPLEYRFYLPESAVRSYRDNAVSGQQLIDASIVLLNGEKIDLKLQ